MQKLKTKIQKFSRSLAVGLLVVAIFVFRISTASAAFNFWGWLDFHSDKDSTDFVIAAANTTPFIPVRVAPATASFTNDATPTLSAAYSDNDVGDVGTVNYRVSSSGLDQCLSATNIVASGTSAETATHSETTTFTPASSIGSDGTYYWCAQNDDGVAQSSWTSMGTFTLDTTDPVISNVVISSDSTYFYEADTDLTGDDDAIYFNSLADEGAGQSITITLTSTETNPDSASGETAFGDSPTDSDDETTQTLIYSIEAGATTFTDLTATVTDKATTSANYDVDFIADNSGPTGGSITYSTQFINSLATDPAVVVADGLDSGAGLDTSTRILKRATATLAGGTCGSFGEYSATTTGGTYPNLTDTATIATATCYRYSWAISDRVGNSATFVSTDEFKVDTATPDAVAVDAGASSADRVSLTSGTWFKSSDIGDDDQISASWTDPDSASDDNFYFELNSTATATIDGTESSTATVFVDSISVTEGTNYFHLRPKTGAGTFGTERIFELKYDKTAPTVQTSTLTSPNGGEIWTGGGGAKYDIEWTTTDFTDALAGLGATPISLDYSTDGGSEWTSIATGEANDGSYSWTTPAISDAEMRIRITATDAAGNSASDSSDADFRLSAHDNFIALHLVDGNNQIGGMDSTLTTDLKMRVGNGADSGETFAGADAVEVSFTLFSVPETPTAAGQNLANGSFGTTFGGTSVIKTVTTDANGYVSVALTLGDRAGNYTVVGDFTGVETAAVDRTFTATEREVFQFTIANPDINIDVNPFNSSLGSGSTTLTVTSNAASYQINIDPDVWPTYNQETIGNWSGGFGFGWDNNGAGENGTTEASPFDELDTPTDAYVCSGDTCQGIVEFTLDFHASIDYSYEVGTYQNTLTVEGVGITF